MAAIFQTTFSYSYMNFDYDFTEVCFKGSIDNIPALVQLMAWCRPGEKPLSEPMVVRLRTHICVTRLQCNNGLQWGYYAINYPFAIFLNS